MAENKGNRSNLAFHIYLVLEYPVAVLKGVQFLVDGFFELGYDVGLEGEAGRGFTVLEKTVSVGEELSGAYQDIIESEVQFPNSFSDIGKLLKLMGKLGSSGNKIKKLVDEEGVGGDLYDAFFENLIKILILKTYEFALPPLYDGLVLATVIRPGSEAPLTDYLRDDAGKIIRFPHAVSVLDPSRISSLLQDPIKVLKEEYFNEPLSPPGASNDADETQDPQLKLVSDKFFKRLRRLLAHSKANVVYGLKPADWLDFNDPIAREVSERTLTFWYEFEVKDDDLEIGATMAFVRQEDNRIGLAVLPFGGWKKDFLLNDWKFELDATQFSEPFVINGDNETAPGEIATRFTFRLSRGAEEAPAYDIGLSNSIRLELGRIRIEGGFALPAEQEEIGIISEFLDSKFVFDVSKDDGFLRKYFPRKGFDVGFDLGIGWSSVFGFYIKGGTGLEVEFSKHIQFAKIIELTAIQLGANASNREIRLYAALSANLDLGPVFLKVDTVGMQFKWIPDKQFLKSPDQDPLDFDFKPPKGVGIKVDAKAVKGSGFLFFDKDRGQYAGVADLNVVMFDVEVNVKAVGIINTKAPDGTEGFSFLLLISAEFSPVRVGPAFNWSGIGGLIGINRAMDTEAIRLGVRDKTLDNILFPENPLDNAKQIIVSANTVFPMQDDRYVFGIMAILGWGTKNLVTLELGILVEAKDPWKLAIVGVAKASVSKQVGGKELSVLKLQVNFAGIIDFERKFFSFDASLFDSTLLTFRFEGDIAIRVQWGEPKCFLLSVGGFHPDFNDIPQAFPPMTRLLMPLVDRKRAQIVLTFYMAITPNSFQLGAGVFFFLKIFKVNLRGEFSFDALFYSRSNFYAPITAELEVRVGSKTLFGVKFTGRFSGTSPWNLSGQFKIKFLFWTFCPPPVDQTYGETIDTTLAAISLLPELKNELKDEHNWQEIIPPATKLLVTVKGDDQGEDGEQLIVLHPTGGIKVSQTLLPLNIRLNKFGAQNIEGINRFDLTLVDSSGRVVAINAERDMFPPGMYLELTDEEKLSRKSYESLHSGISMQQAEQVKLGSFSEKPLAYEKIVFDGVERRVEPAATTEDANLFGFFSAGNTTARSEFGANIRPSLHAGVDEIESIEERYVVVYNRDLAAYEEWAHRESQTEAFQLLEDILEAHPHLENQLSVVPVEEMV